MLDRFGFPLKKNTFFEQEKHYDKILNIFTIICFETDVYRCEYIGGGFSYGD